MFGAYEYIDPIEPESIKDEQKEPKKTIRKPEKKVINPHIEGFELTQRDIGKGVIFEMTGIIEEGVITSFNSLYVFVKFGNEYHSKACKAEDLRWAKKRKRKH